MRLDEAKEILKNSGYLIEDTKIDYEAEVKAVEDVISKKHEILDSVEVPAQKGYKIYKIVTKDNKFYTLEFKNNMFEYRNNYYPWRVTLETGKYNFVVLAYNIRQLKDYFNKVH